MSIRTTVTLDEDVAIRLREASALQGVPFRKMLNEALRFGLTALSKKPDPAEFKIEPFDMGPFKYPIDDMSALLDYLEGEDRRW